MKLDELAAYLESKAKSKRTVFYSDLVTHFALPPLDDAWIDHPLARAFAVLDQQDADAKRPFRTSVVIAKETNMPGSGYFKSLSALKGVRTNTEKQRLEVFARELQAAMDYPW